MDNIKVISLQRTPERLARFAELNGHLDYTVFPAIDGSKLTEAAILQNVASPWPPYTPGAIGCALSHRTLWEYAYSLGEPVTVLEDDALVRFDFDTEASRVLAAAPADWDIVVWGWNFDMGIGLNMLPQVAAATLVIEPGRFVANAERFQSLNTRAQLYPLAVCAGSVAYTVSPAGAAKLRASCFPLTNFALRFPTATHASRATFWNTGIDVAMSRAYSHIQAFAAVAPLVGTLHDIRASTTRD